MCKNLNIYKLQKGNETLHPFSVPLNVWSQIEIYLIEPLKPTKGQKYIVRGGGYTIRFAETEL